MSVQANRDDYWQKTGKGTVRERCQAIFNQELLSDVKFAVCNFQAGSESKTIPAHKVRVSDQQSSVLCHVLR